MLKISEVIVQNLLGKIAKTARVPKEEQDRRRTNRAIGAGIGAAGTAGIGTATIGTIYSKTQRRVHDDLLRRAERLQRRQPKLWAQAMAMEAATEINNRINANRYHGTPLDPVIDADKLRQNPRMQRMTKEMKSGRKFVDKMRSAPKMNLRQWLKSPKNVGKGLLGSLPFLGIGAGIGNLIGGRLTRRAEPLTPEL